MSNLNEYLFTEKPILINVDLACKIGIKESILLEYLANVINQKGVLIDGRKWLKIKKEEIKQDFCFFSVSQIGRILDNLKRKKCIEYGSFNKSQLDRTKWYSLSTNLSIK